jgi:hypothetical protein
MLPPSFLLHSPDSHSGQRHSPLYLYLTTPLKRITFWSVSAPLHSVPFPLAPLPQRQNSASPTLNKSSAHSQTLEHRSLTFCQVAKDRGQLPCHLVLLQSSSKHNVST